MLTFSRLIQHNTARETVVLKEMKELPGIVVVSNEYHYKRTCDICKKSSLLSIIQSVIQSFKTASQIHKPYSKSLMYATYLDTIAAVRASPIITGATGFISALSMVVCRKTRTRRKVSRSSTRTPWTGLSLE